jgi:rod shape-determining protein MreC
MAVITAGGIVGKVWIVYPSTSLVLMINDQSSGVGALLEKSRLQGVLRGTPDGELILERVMSDETVIPGETVLSSGGDQIFPKGLPVGTVTKVSPGHEMFLSIKVKPAADLSRLEEVLVVTEKQEREPATADNATRMRAADILAQRLPSVPDKPAAVVGTAPAGSGANGAPVSLTGANARPQANIAGKPLAASGSSAAAAKLTGTAGSASAAANKSIMPASRPASGDTLKQVVQKPSADGSVIDNSAKPTGGTVNGAGTSSATAPRSAPKPATPAAKPAAQPKPTNPPANPQPQPPPVTENNPH